MSSQIHSNSNKASHSKTIILGRDGTQPFKIENEGVSHQHARVTKHDGGAWMLEDLDSTNGTYVRNDDGEFEKIKKCLIDKNSVVRLGGGTMHSLTFWANRLTVAEDSNYGYEFSQISQMNEAFTGRIEQETNKLRMKRFMPIAISIIVTVLSYVIPATPSIQMWILRIGMQLGPIYSALCIKNDKIIDLMNKKKKLITCPMCGRPLSDFEIQQRLCLACKAHA